MIFSHTETAVSVLTPYFSLLCMRSKFGKGFTTFHFSKLQGQPREA